VPHVLHLLKDPGNRTALDVLAAQARNPDNRLTVVLLEGAAQPNAALPGDVYRLAEGNGSPPSQYPVIDHARLLELIFGADTVVTW
jgi:hypothetical protein